MKQTTAQLKANKKYLSTLDEFKVRCEKGAKDKYKAQAAHRGFSLNSYVIALLERSKGRYLQLAALHLEKEKTAKK